MRSSSGNNPGGEPWIGKAVKGAWNAIPEDFDWSQSASFAHVINGYELAPALGLGDAGDLANLRRDDAGRTGAWQATPSSSGSVSSSSTGARDTPVSIPMESRVASWTCSASSFVARSSTRVARAKARVSWWRVRRGTADVHLTSVPSREWTGVGPVMVAAASSAAPASTVLAQSCARR